jgi:hypothetical protein
VVQLAVSIDVAAGVHRCDVLTPLRMGHLHVEVALVAYFVLVSSAGLCRWRSGF